MIQKKKLLKLSQVMVKFYNLICKDALQKKKDIKLFHGEFIQKIKLLPDESVNLCIMDSPFGVSFKGNKYFDDSLLYLKNNLDDWMRESCRILEEGSHIYVYAPTLYLDVFINSFKKYFNFKNVLVFPTFTKNKYMADNFTYNAQFVLFGSKGKPKRLNEVDWIPTSETWYKDIKRNPSSKLYTYQYPNFIPFHKVNIKTNKYVKRIHPNQKNVEVLEYFIQLSTNPGEVVFDGFAGSGSTLIAAMNTGRKCIGIEKNSTYVEIIKNRIISNW